MKRYPTVEMPQVTGGALEWGRGRTGTRLSEIATAMARMDTGSSFLLTAATIGERTRRAARLQSRAGRAAWLQGRMSWTAMAIANAGIAVTTMTRHDSR